MLIHKIITMVKNPFAKKTFILLLLLLFQGLFFSYLGYSLSNFKQILFPTNDSVLLPEASHDNTLFKSVKIYNYRFKENDTFFEVLKKLGIPSGQIVKLTEASRPTYCLKKIKPGQTIQIAFNTKTQIVSSLTYEIDPTLQLLLRPAPNGFCAFLVELPFHVKPKLIAQTINNSLYIDGVNAGLSPQQVMELTDIFSWDIDFFVDLRRGDTFTVLYEEKERNGEVITTGKILAAEIKSRGVLHRAFYFESAEGRGGYYDENGRSVQKQFLKSPLRYSRISSYFTSRRFHPILKRYRPHYGIDYAAPTGTPVEAIADGVIMFAGWGGDYGKQIRIRHKNRYISYYGHLSRFARGMKKGRRVRQGQVIGYVGRTGLATGPHLDFRMVKNGRFINPLKIKNTIADRVPGKKQAAFQRLVQNRLSQMSKFEHSPIAIAKKQ